MRSIVERAILLEVDPVTLSMAGAGLASAAKLGYMLYKQNQLENFMQDLSHKAVKYGVGGLALGTGIGGAIAASGIISRVLHQRDAANAKNRGRNGKRS